MNHHSVIVLYVNKEQQGSYLDEKTHLYEHFTVQLSCKSTAFYFEENNIVRVWLPSADSPVRGPQVGSAEGAWPAGCRAADADADDADDDDVAAAAG